MHRTPPAGVRRRRFRSCRRLSIAVAAACTVALAAPAAAFAHATLLRTVPAAGGVVAAAPRQLLLEFDQQIEPVAGATGVVDAAGRSVLGGTVHASAADVRTLVIPLRPRLPDGDYTVRWSVVSTDGHIVSGVFAIGVGAGRPPPQAATTESSSYDWPFLTARFGYFLGLMLLVGGAVFQVAVLRPAMAAMPPQRRAAAAARERQRSSQLFMLGAVLMLGGGWVALNRQGAEVAGVSFWQAFNHAGPIPSALQATRFGRVFGRGIDLGAAFVVALPVAAIAYRRSRPLGLAAAVVAAALGAWAVTVPGLSGHAGDPGLGPLAVAVDALHTAAACVWIGGLAQLVRVVPHATRGLPDGLRDDVRTALVRRFSRIALCSVGVVAVTGVARALWQVSAVSQLATTGYGRALVAKALLLAAAVAVAATNRRRLQRFSWVRRGAGAELALLVVLTAVVALLTDLPPASLPATATAGTTPARPPGGVASVSLAGGGRLDLWPGRAGPNAVAVRLPGTAPSLPLLVQSGSSAQDVRLARMGGAYAGFVDLPAGTVSLQFAPGGRAAGATIRIGPAGAPPALVPAPTGDGAVAAEEAADLAVGLQRVAGGRARVTLIDASGGGVADALVRVAGRLATPCPGVAAACYAVRVPAAASALPVSIARPGRGPVTAVVKLPAAVAPSAAGLLRRSSAAYRALTTVRSENVLRSSPTVSVTTTYVSQQPHRVLIDVHGEQRSLIIGTRRYTQIAPGARWSVQSGVPPPVVPDPFWDVDTSAIRLAAEQAGAWVITFVSNPPGSPPAFFRLWIGRRSGQVLRLRMITAAHFMWECEVPMPHAALLRPPPNPAVAAVLHSPPACSPDGA